MSAIMPITAYTLTAHNAGGYNAIQLKEFSGIMEQVGLILIQNVNFEDNDLNTPIVALNDKRVLYSFGKNFGQVEISGTIYNTSCKHVDFEVINTLYQKFNEIRVSASLRTTMLSIADEFKCDLFLTDFRIGNANPVLQAIGFSLKGIVVPPTNKGG